MTIADIAFLIILSGIVLAYVALGVMFVWCRVGRGARLEKTK